MIAALEGPSIRVHDRSPGLCLLADALSELLDRYPEVPESAEELPVIVVEDAPEELCPANVTRMGRTKLPAESGTSRSRKKVTALGRPSSGYLASRT